jgi:hypothetical protein
MTDNNLNVTPDDPAAFQFRSKLSDARQRFLAHAMEHAFSVGRRSADDFIRHFPPEVIMEGMAQQAELRASILSQTTGLKLKIALKKSWKSAAEDLRIALAEGETNAKAVISVFAPDDRVLYLPHDKIWAFLTEGDFHNVSATRATEHRIAKQHIAFMLDCGLRDGLLGYKDIVDGVTMSELSARLPKAELGKLIEAAIVAGRNKKLFTDTELWSALTSATLVEHVPLAHIWFNVIVPKIAKAHGFGSEAGAAPSQARAAEPSNAKEEQDWVELPEDNAASSDLISEDDFA